MLSGWPPQAALAQEYALEHDGATLRIGVAISKQGIIAALDEQLQALAVSTLTGDAQATPRLKKIP